MPQKKRWFALLAPALLASAAAAAWAQPKGPPTHAAAGIKHAGAGMHGGPGRPAPMIGRGPGMRDKAQGRNHEAKGNDEAKGKVEQDGNAETPPSPPSAPDETLRHPPDHRAGHGAAPNAELRQKWQQRRADQMKRRRAALQDLRDRWGDGELLKPDVKAAIKLHAWRMARLQRIRELALQDPDGKDLVEKVDKLTEKEEERFRLQMARMKRGSDVGTVGDTGSAAPGATPAPSNDPPTPPTAGKKDGAK
jgi:hypothetical protein